MGLAGIVADLVNHNIPLIYIVSGALMTGLTLWLCLSRDLGAFLAREGAPDQAAGSPGESEPAPGALGGEGTIPRPVV